MEAFTQEFVMIFSNGMTKQTNDKAIAISVLDSHPNINCAMRREGNEYKVVYIDNVQMNKLP